MIASKLSPWVAGIAVGAWFGIAAACNAQQVRRYEPSRPTVSPYLNLFRNQTGVIPNYQSLVRPLLQQNVINQQQRQINAQGGAAIGQLQSGLTELQQQALPTTMTPTGKSGWFLQPSSRQSFMNTSRYYERAGSSAQAR